MSDVVFDLTTTGAARLLGCREARARQLADEGRVRCIRVAGNMRLLCRGDVEALRDQMRSTDTTPPHSSNYEGGGR
jgi:excisionase family DNA binding protein